MLFSLFDIETGWYIDDFEFHDERSIKKKNPEIDLYVAIKVKE